MKYLSDLSTQWSSLYANHAALRTTVVFAHVASLIVGGGAAIAADRAVLRAASRNALGLDRQLEVLHSTHRVVVASLGLVVVSGLMMFASDVTTFLYSRVFWTKMALVALLVANGALLWNAEERLRRDDSSALTTLRITALVSAALWLLATLAGVTLTNIG